jgi:hypothetical protein
MNHAALAAYSIVVYVIGCYMLAFVSWFFYVTVMGLAARRDQLGPLVRWHAYPIVAVGFALDFVLQMLVGTILFLDPPREWLLSPRLTRYRRDPDETWRRDLACWICTNLLDPFDPRGHHC